MQALYRDVAVLVDASALKIPSIQENSKKSIERVRATLSEAAGIFTFLFSFFLSFFL